MSGLRLRVGCGRPRAVRCAARGGRRRAAAARHRDRERHPHDGGADLARRRARAERCRRSIWSTTTQLNSFVAGGQAIFINTGLILRAENAEPADRRHRARDRPYRRRPYPARQGGDEERQHRGDHRDGRRRRAPARPAQRRADAAAAGVGERAFMQFSIAQEATADHAALNFLDRTCQSARGLLEVLRDPAGRRACCRASRRPVGAHPSADRRADRLRPRPCRPRALLERARARPATTALMKPHQGQAARLSRRPVDRPSRAYPESDKSVLARYARAIAYYRIPKLDKALPVIDGLIRDFPNNPYYRELKGPDAVRERPRAARRSRPTRRRCGSRRSQALLRISLSQVYIESNDPALNKRAIAYLNDAAAGRGPRQHGVAFSRGRLRPRQPARHGRAVAGRGGARQRQEDRMRCSRRSGRSSTCRATRPAYFARRGHHARGRTSRQNEDAIASTAIW